MSNKKQGKDLKSLADFRFDGKAALRAVIEASEYRTLPQAVAALTLFTHPETVKQTNSSNLFKVIRCKSTADRGKKHTMEDGTVVMLHDNTPPTEAFTWTNGLSQSKCVDVQFNHIWSDSQVVHLYTNLANICVSPAFLAKLTDTDDEIRKLLRYRAFALYGFAPLGKRPEKPKNYDSLTWAPSLPPVSNLERQLRSAMARKKKNQTVLFSREHGWVFSNYGRDERL